MHSKAALILMAMVTLASAGRAEILGTTANVRPDNSLIVDVQVTTGSSVAKLQITYETPGVDPLVSKLTPASRTGSTIITIGRLRANRAYTYTVSATNQYGGPAGVAHGSFTTGALPAALAANTYSLQGHTTAPLIILPHIETNFRGYVALDLHSQDAPQIVWFYSNAPSKASGVTQVDPVNSIVQQQNG